MSIVDSAVFLFFRDLFEDISFARCLGVGMGVLYGMARDRSEEQCDTNDAKQDKR